MSGRNGELLEIALHESGHSVIARALGLKCGRATMCDHDGVARAYFKTSGHGINGVIALLAGRAATEVILGFASDHGCSVDDAEAMELLIADGIRVPWYARRVRQQCLDQARELIRQHRPAVEAVANALLERETLSGAEIDQLMMDAEAWRRVTR
jgi:ATP-dependent Zn protease